MPQQQLVTASPLIDYDEQNAYNQALSQNISSCWDDLKDSLYLYSICAHQYLEQYESDVIEQTKVLHTHLEDSPDFIYDLHLSKLENRNGNPWFWQRLMQDHYLHAGLMTVYEDYITPLHDYNNLAVVLYILDGQVKLTRYQNQPSSITPYYPIARVVKTQEQFLTAGDTITSPGTGNIIEIQSLTKRSVILTMHLIKSQSELGAWYFPISPKPTENYAVFFAQRIRRSI